MAWLTSLRLAGWKSIRDAILEFRPLNILIGANGAGKSNLVSFFKLVSAMMEERLQVEVGTMGGAESLLHFGSKRTDTLRAELQLPEVVHRVTMPRPRETAYVPIYSFTLVPAPVNSLLFAEERLEFHTDSGVSPGDVHSFGGGHRETVLTRRWKMPTRGFPGPIGGMHKRAALGRLLQSRCGVYHFHDTSPQSPIRRDCEVDANRFLYSDAANLPAMLYLYRERHPTAYRQIIAAVRAIAPFFDDFVLEPLRLNPRNISLRWRAKGSEYEFGPHQLSDGTLRGIALFTLLLQPQADLPSMIVLDEPELGLHPSALAILADLMKETSRHSQLLIATQSTALIDHFEAEDVITVNLRDGASEFMRLDPEGLRHWLDEYSLSELWERNVVGGGPY